MKVRQIIPPSLHPLSKPFWAQFKYQRQHDFFVYPSQDSVFILDRQLLVHQTLRLADHSKHHPHHVSSIAWHKHHGMLAIAVAAEILLFRCAEQAALPQWQFVTNLAVPEAKSSTESPLLLEWRGVTARDTCLLVSRAHTLQLYELRTWFEQARGSVDHSEPAPQWQGPLPRESASRMACSPCGRYLAVSGAHHCCVKLWYRASNARTGLNFLYLPHSRALVDMQWRENARGRAVLLTLSADGCVNLWTESPLSERVNFTLSLVIDEGEGYSATKHSSATTTFGGIVGVSWLADPVRDESADKEESATQGAHSHALKHTGHAMTRNIQERQGSTASVTSGGSQDWLLGVQQDGGVQVWKVKGLNEHPLQAPIVVRLSCSKGVLPPQLDWLHLAVSAQLFAFPSEPHSYAPSLFNLYALAPHKRTIAGWSVSLSAARISATINRLHGHDAPIALLAAHARLPLVASLDQHHRLLVWRVQDQHVIDAPLLCTHLATQEHCRTFCWDLTEPVIYTVIGNEGLFMNEIVFSADEHVVAPMTPVTPLIRVSANTDWAQLLCLPAVTHTALEPHTAPRSVHLAALSKSGDAIKVYRITRAPEPTAQLLCAHESDEEVYTHLAAPQHGQPGSAPCTLFSGSASGVVHGWMLMREDEDDEVTLQTVLHFQAHSAPLTQLRVNYLGRLASMTRDELKIWELESSVPQYRRESLADPQLTHSTQTAQPSALSIGAALSPLISVAHHTAATAQHAAPLDLDWYTTPEGHSLLAVLTRDAVRLYEFGCNRAQLEAFTPEWTLLHTIALGTAAHQGLAWSVNGVLLSAQERQLSAVSKWSEGSHSSARTVSVLAQLAQTHRPLPVYHPKKLVQYLMTGQFDRLALVFKQLFLHLSDESKRQLSFDLPLDTYLAPQTAAPSTAQSVSAPPVPAHTASAAPKPAAPKPAYDFLDDPYDQISFSTLDDDVEVEVSDSDEDEQSDERASGDEDEDDWGLSARQNNASSATHAQSAAESVEVESDKPDELSAGEASALVELLTRRELEGVTRRDQMFVLAVLDLFTSGMLAKQHLHTSQAWTPVGCAIRFQVQVKIGLYMSRFAPPPSKKGSAAPQDSELVLSALDWCWALHALEHEALVTLTVPAEPTWSTLRALGVALWCQHVPTLRTLAERVAKSEYLRHKNAEDCALYYLALRKKVALQQLYKTQKDETLVKFLANDFEHERWKTAAQKNAYVLLSKQRYHLAAAFFLLADQLRDAVSICVQKLNDYHLALFVARLFEGDLGEISRDLLTNHVLPLARSSADLGLASLSQWLLRDYEAALLALVGAQNTVATHWHAPLAPAHVPSVPHSESVTSSFAPGAAHLFRYLQQHRHLKAQDYAAQHALLQRRLLYAYLHAGCTHLTLAPLVHDTQHRGPGALVDAHLRAQVAMQLAALRVDEARRVKSEDLSGAVQLIDLLAAQLAVPRAALFEALIRYSSEQHYLREEMLLTVEHSNAPLDALRLLLKTSRRISALLRVTPQLSRAQAARLDQQARELHACAWLYKQRYRPQLQARSVPVIDARAYHHDTLKARSTLSNSASNVSTLAQDEPASKEEEKAMIEIFAASRLGACLAALAVQDYQCLHELLFNGLDLNHVRPLDAGLVVVPVTRPRSDSSSEDEDEHPEPEQTRDTPQGMTGLSSDEDLDLPPDLPRVTDDTASDEEDREQIHTRVASELDKLQLDARTEQWCQQVLQLMIVRAFTEQLELLLNQVFKNPKNVTVVKQLHKWLTEFELCVAVTPALLLHFKLAPITVPGASEDESSAVVPSLASTDWLVIEHVMRKARVLRQQRYAQLVWQQLVAHKSAVKYLSKTDYLKQDQQIIHTQRVLTRVTAITRTLTFSEPSTAFKSKESILSLCVNPCNEKNVVIATHKGLSELTLRAHQFNAAGTTEVQLTPRTASTLTNSSNTLAAPSSRKVLSASNSPLVSQHTRSPRAFTEHSTPASPAQVHRGADHGYAWVEAHPHDPYYIAGGFDGSVTLWQFSLEAPICTYKTTGHAKITRIRFNWNGTKFAVGDQNGYLNVWRFDGSVESLEPYLTIQCHTKRVTDLAFINSGSFIATAGVTNGIGVVSFWDTLCPPTKQEVYRLVPDHAFGANTGKISSLLWVSSYQLLVLGTKRGQVRLWDPRTMAPLPSHYKDALGASSSLSFSTNSLGDSSGNIVPTVKQSSIRALGVVDKYLVQGGRNGSVTVWDLDALAHSATVVSLAAWPEVHRALQMTRSGLETNGVTAMFTGTKHLYTTGADGRVVERKFRRQLMPHSQQ